MKILHFFLIIILGLAVYANSLQGEFLWDDEQLIEDNIYIKSPSYIRNIFTENIKAGAGRTTNFYRPLQMLTLMGDYALWKLDVRGYHLSNILLHILAALALYQLIYTLYNDRLVALFSSLFFTVHPIHTEVVSYISGRADSLAYIFVLFGLIFYVRYLSSEKVPLYILALSSYILALLSKENSLIFPLLILLYHYALQKRLKVKNFLPFLCLALLYVLLRVKGLSFVLSEQPKIGTLFQRLPGFFVAIVNYLRLLFLPFNLHMEYGYRQFYFHNPKAILGMLVLASLLVYAAKQRKTFPLASFSVFWFFLALLPSSNLYPINAYMSEHWLYLPSIGFFLILGKGLSLIYRTRELRTATVVSLAGLLGLYACLTVKQNNYWKKPITFYEETLKYAPDSPRMNSNLGNIYSELGRTEEAIALFKKTIAIDPSYAPAYNNLGNIYNALGKKQEAISLYQKTIAIDPDFVDTYNNLGVVYHSLNRNQEAIASYQKALELNPRHLGAYTNFALLYLGIGEKEEAISLFKKATEVAPGAATYGNLGHACKSIGRIEESIAAYRKATEFEPKDAVNYYNLGLLYSTVGKNEEAIALYKQAIKIDSNYAPAYNDLAIVYVMLGKYEEAVPLFERAVAIEPNAGAYNNLALACFHQKQYKLAIEYCDRAKELGFPVHPEFLRDLAPYR